MRESSFIEWICRQTPGDPQRVLVGPGDDSAVVRLEDPRVVVTTDQVLDGVHVRLVDHGPKASGRKAMARGLSDIAAMAALPVAAVATVALPRQMSQANAEAIYQGLRSAGDAFDCPLVGGDVGCWDAPLAISVTILGRCAQDQPILRCGASSGEAICVTGAFGGAWRTQRHLEFVPRIREALALAERYSPRAMIDVSDGLGLDLSHICSASGVGAEIWADAVPIHADAKRQEGEVPPGLAAALGDGEDYELLFTLPGEQAESLLRDKPLSVPVHRIGRTIPAGEGLVLILPDGRREPLPESGWEHAS